MDDKKKKLIFVSIVAIAVVILFGVGSTFAYFSATISSEENAVSFGAAVFELSLKDDISLLKTQLIPSKEEYVDIAMSRLDSDGNLLKPYEQEGKLITENTICIDDNLNEICSVYSFTIENAMTDMDLPLYVTLNPATNTFKNLYFQVIQIVDNEETGQKEIIEVIDATPIPNGDEIYASGATDIPPIVLDGINTTLPKAESEDKPSTVTYSIVLFIKEIGADQTIEDSSQVFAGGIKVTASGANGQGITGVFSAGGEE